MRTEHCQPISSVETEFLPNGKTRVILRDHFMTETRPEEGVPYTVYTADEVSFITSDKITPAYAAGHFAELWLVGENAGTPMPYDKSVAAINHKENTMFVKFIDRYTVEPWIPPVLVTNGKTFIHPSPQILKKYGFLPLVEDIEMAGGQKIYSTDEEYVFSHTIPREEVTYDASAPAQ